MSKTRRSAQVTERLARFGYYDPNEALTGIGNATARQVLEGYDTPNIQSAIDDLYYLTTVNIGGLLATKYPNNPNPPAWGVYSGSPQVLIGRPQIEDIKVSGLPTNTFWYTINGVEVELTHGDTADTVATKVQAVLDTLVGITATIGSPTNTVTITYLDYSDQPAITTPAVQYGVTAGISTPTPGSSSPQVNEVQTITFTGTVAITGTVNIIDNLVSPNVLIAGATVTSSSTAATVKTALQASLVAESPTRFASVTSIDSTTIRITYLDNESHTLQYDSFNGILVKGELVQRNISNTDILKTATNQKDRIKIIVNTSGITELPMQLTFTDLGIWMNVLAGTSEAQIASDLESLLSGVPGIITSNLSANELDIEYTDTVFAHATSYKEWFNVSGSQGISSLLVSPEAVNPGSPMYPVEIRYTPLTSLNTNGEVNYGKWVYYGEGIINAPTEQDFHAASVETSVNLFGEPFLLSSPNSKKFTFSKDLFTVARVLCTAKSSNMGSPQRGKFYSSMLTILNSGTDVNWTEDTLISNDTLQSDVHPFNISCTIVGNNVEVTVTRATTENIEMSMKLLDQDKITSVTEQVKVYYWERIL